MGEICSQALGAPTPSGANASASTLRAMPSLATYVFASDKSVNMEVLLANLGSDDIKLDAPLTTPGTLVHTSTKSLVVPAHQSKRIHVTLDRPKATEPRSVSALTFHATVDPIRTATISFALFRDIRATFAKPTLPCGTLTSRAAISVLSNSPGSHPTRNMSDDSPHSLDATRTKISDVYFTYKANGGGEANAVAWASCATSATETDGSVALSYDADARGKCGVTFSAGVNGLSTGRGYFGPQWRTSFELPGDASVLWEVLIDSDVQRWNPAQRSVTLAFGTSALTLKADGASHDTLRVTPGSHALSVVADLPSPLPGCWTPSDGNGADIRFPDKMSVRIRLHRLTVSR